MDTFIALIRSPDNTRQKFQTILIFYNYEYKPFSYINTSIPQEKTSLSIQDLKKIYILGKMKKRGGIHDP
jgi:hypothetical protein